jgi:abortive infection bacteriophage resistance protein
MHKIDVKIGWSGNNYSCVADDKVLNGIVVVTSKTLDGLKKEFKESLQFHIEGCLQDGDKFPQWVILGLYEFNYIFDVSALLHSLDGILTRSAIARVSGINEKQIGHYAAGIRKPRQTQRNRIINAIHNISKELAEVYSCCL